MKRSPLHQLILYLLLIAGAVVFSFPFVWMFSASVKTDREQYGEKLKILPTTPLPRAVSPYVDETVFDNLSDIARERESLLPTIAQWIEESQFELPSDVDRAAMIRSMSKGVLQRLSQRVPLDVWNGDEQKLIRLARPMVDAEMLRQTADVVYRFLAIGDIRVRGSGVAIHELQADRKPSERWQLRSDAKVSVSDITDQSKPAAKIGYDFAGGSTITLVGDFALPIDASDLRRVQIDLHPDDTWHNCRLTVEHNGKRYVSRRDSALSNVNWFSSTWQHASPDDASTKLRTWIVLDEAGASEVTGSRDLRLTLDFQRVTRAYAWANKVRQNYIRTNEQIPFWRYVRVSVFLVIANITLTIFSCSLAAYAFARLNWPGRDFCFLLMLATMMIPGQVTMIPNFLIWKWVGGYNTLSPLWVGAAFGNAFMIFMLRQFMRGIPRDLEDAARIDGCGFLRIYWHVILPLIKPSLAAIAVMTFIACWNDFMGPLIYIADQRLYPLAFGLYAFSVQINNNPALSMAGSVLMTLPIIAIFFAAQRYFIQGVTLTGIKG